MATFQGAMTALVTPFRNGEVDLDALSAHVEEQLANGIRGLVPCGTTGEAPTLSTQEKRKVIRRTVEVAAGRVPVVAGTGTNNTRSAVELSRMAKQAGAEALLVVTPYYNKPTQEGLCRYYRAIRDAVAMPIVAYSVPGRTGIALSSETVARLYEEGVIAALKEAGGSVDKVSETLQCCGIDVLSGDDALTLAMMSVGARGVISVLSNVMPQETAAMVEGARDGDYEAARTWHQRLYPLARALFLESNPIPVKAALQLLGKGSGEVRPPLCELSAPAREKLRAVLRRLLDDPKL